MVDGGAGGCVTPSGATLAKLRLLISIFRPAPRGGVELPQMILGWSWSQSGQVGLWCWRSCVWSYHERHFDRALEKEEVAGSREQAGGRLEE